MNTWDLLDRALEPHRPDVLLSQQGGSRGIALRLPAGDLLQEHETREAAWVVVVDGELEVEHASSVRRAGRGTVLHFAAHERRELRAVADATVLLILAPWPAPDHPGATV